MPKDVKLGIKSEYSRVNIEIKEIPSSISLYADEYVSWKQDPENEHAYESPRHIEKYSAEYLALYRFLKDHADAFNYNKSDYHDGYSDFNFLLTVQASYDLQNSEMERHASEIESKQAQEPEAPKSKPRHKYVYGIKPRPFEPYTANKISAELGGDPDTWNIINEDEMTPDEKEHGNEARYGLITSKKPLSDGLVSSLELVDMQNTAASNEMYEQYVELVEERLRAGYAASGRDFNDEVKEIVGKLGDVSRALKSAGHNPSSVEAMIQKKIDDEMPEDSQASEPEPEAEDLAGSLRKRVESLRSMSHAEYEDTIDDLLEEIESAGMLEEFEAELTAIDESFEDDLKASQPK